MSKPGLAARQTAAILLTRIIDDGRGLDGLFDSRHGPSQLRNLSDVDRSLVRAIVTTALRHRGEIEFALAKALDRKTPKNARQLLHTLHIAVAQILFMDVPDSAAVDLAVSALRDDKRSVRFSGLANAVLRRIGREKDKLFEQLNDDETALLNMGPWLKKRARTDYGKARLAAIANQHMLEPVLDLSVRSDPGSWAEKLGGIHLFGNSIRINAPGRIEKWAGYEDGSWWVQDAAASLPVQLFGNLEGKSALDLCAAPGGKTAQLVLAGARVTALEKSEPRLQRLKTNLERLKFQADCVRADMMDWEPSELFDAVLLDAPCSSTGTIRRHPDVQWTKSPQIIEQLAELQYQMVLRASQFLKPGGTLVFANCSLDRAEGEDVYSRVLASTDDLQPAPISSDEVFGQDEFTNRQGTVRTLPCHLQSPGEQGSNGDVSPSMTGLDGFFCARFTRQT